MLLSLEESILRLPSEHRRAVLRWLAQAHIDGHHFIIAPSAVFRKICADQEGYSDVFRHIARRRNDGEGLRSIIGEVAALGVHGQANVLPVDKIDTPRRLAPSFLVGENPLDAEFYVRVARAYVCHLVRSNTIAHARGVNISLTPIGGGGSTTGPQIRLIRQHSAAVAIVDSDRIAPNAQLGSTARSALDANALIGKDLSPRSNIYGDVLVLKDREIENILPRELIIDALPKTMDLGLKRRIIRLAERESIGCGGFDDLKLIMCENIFDHVAAYVFNIGDHRLCQYLFTDPLVGGRWQEIGRFLLRWGCAPTISRVF